MTKLAGKVALITGSGRGIGRAIALKLASEGAKIVVNDLDSAPGDAVAAEIVAAGGQAIAVNGSVSDTGFPDRFVGAAVEKLGGLDIIVNNAGYTWDSTIQKMTDEQFQAMLDVHLVAPFRSRSRPRGVPQGRQHLVDRGALRQCRAGQLFVGESVSGRIDAHHVQGVGPLQGQR
jgi:NAD(P)-dependent dehydrogenase (short-subunit alcohol dehydrogenase family)